MENSEIIQKNNPLESESIGKLIAKYSLPAIISSLVSSLYNIIDQIFVGHSIGELGNAATNVAFPLVMIMTTLAMVFGVGGASSFSLYLGQKNEHKTKNVVGSSLTLLLSSGIVLAALASIFLRPMLTAFGGRGQTLQYAIEYTRIVALGAPLAMLETGAAQLIRADGSPRYAMAANLTGAILNCILDPVLIFGCNMGMSGAAIATVTGQLVAGIIILFYFSRFKTFRLTVRDFTLKKESVGSIFALGVPAGANQLAVTIVQIVMNNTLGYYGELSQYGRDIPLACVGIISKVNSVFNSVIFGIAQSTQPIIGYNYGAKNYERVRAAFMLAAKIVFIVSLCAFLCFQLIPRPIINVFGSSDDPIYYEFALKYFHIFLFCTFIVGLQILSAQFFPSIGKGGVGTIVSLSRQVFCLLPLALIFPLFWGIDGVLWAGPIADGVSGVLALLLVRCEMRKWKPGQ